MLQMVQFRTILLQSAHMVNRFRR